MSKHKVDIVGVDTSKLEVLTNIEMVELFKKFQSGDMSARETLIKGNLRLVLSIIKKFNHRGENLDDLFQVGCLGLMKAIDHFDLSHEVKFSTYAVPMIIGEIYILGIGVVFISILIPSFMIMRFNPKKILMNQN